MHIYSQVSLVCAGDATHRGEAPAAWPPLGCWATLTHTLGVLGPSRAISYLLLPTEVAVGTVRRRTRPSAHARALCKLCQSVVASLVGSAEPLSSQFSTGSLVKALPCGLREITDGDPMSGTCGPAWGQTKARRRSRCQSAGTCPQGAEQEGPVGFVGDPDSRRVKRPELMAGRERRFWGQHRGHRGSLRGCQRMSRSPLAKAEKAGDSRGAGMRLEGRGRPDLQGRLETWLSL